MRAFLTESTVHLRTSLAKHGWTIGEVDFFRFADGERGYLLNEEVAGERIALIASVLPASDSFFDLLALKRLLSDNGAAEVCLIIPYLGYARQDRMDKKGTGAIGVMVGDLLRQTQPGKLVVCDVHSEPIRRALGPSMVAWSALPLFAAALEERHPPEVIVSPDAGSFPRAQRLAELLPSHPAVGLIDKVRPRRNVAVARHLQGNVRGKEVLIVDDMIDTGGTIAEAVKRVFENGAANIRIAATHGIFSGAARERLAELPVDQIMVTNTLPQSRHPKIHCIDIVPFIPAIR